MQIEMEASLPVELVLIVLYKLDVELFVCDVDIKCLYMIQR
jgi:hypothetical protein